MFWEKTFLPRVFFCGPMLRFKVFGFLFFSEKMGVFLLLSFRLDNGAFYL